MQDLSGPLGDALGEALFGADLAGSRLLGRGWNADAWLVRRGEEAWVARVPSHDWARGEIERQTCLAPKLAAAGIPVPRDWRLVRAEGMTVAGLYRYVEGNAAPARGRGRAVLARPLAWVLESIHRFPSGEAIACGADELDPWEGRWLPILEQHVPELPPKTRSWAANAGRKLETLCRSAGKPVLVHGDLQPAHVLIAENGSTIAAVLDFSGPIVTDAAIDFGRLAQFWDEPFCRLVLGEYRLPIDEGFVERALLYAALEPLRTVAVEAERGTAVWTPWARRKLAAAAREPA